MGDSPSDTNPYWARDGNFRTLAASDGLLIGGLPGKIRRPLENAQQKLVHLSAWLIPEMLRTRQRKTLMERVAITVVIILRENCAPLVL
jgi:hypothetical protein